jgi:hypothetical protein
VITFRCYSATAPSHRHLLASNLMTLLEGDRRALDGTSPFQVGSDTGAWVIDGRNDWTLLFDDEDPRVFSLQFRDEHRRPREQAFGRWLAVRLSNVEIIENQ